MCLVYMFQIIASYFISCNKHTGPVIRKNLKEQLSDTCTVFIHVMYLMEPMSHLIHSLLPRIKTSSILTHAEKVKLGLALSILS